MKFHNVHGGNITLDEGKHRGSRTSSFCDGITFGDQPLRVNSFVPLKLHSHANQWLGLMFLGVTTRDPSNFVGSPLPKHIIGVYHEDDFWVHPIPHHWANSRITLQLTHNGTLEISANNDANRSFLSHLPLDSPLWLIMDIYGSTTCVQFSTYQTPIPNQMGILGPDMTTAFKCGESGIVPYNRAQIMLIGPPNSGKSKLRKTLLNQSDESASDCGLKKIICYANNEGEWTNFNIPPHSSPIIVQSELSENELYKNLAHNIVKEITLANKEKSENSNTKYSPKELVKNILKFSARKIRKAYSKEVKELSDTVNAPNDVSEKLTEMVEELMKNVQSNNSENNEENDTNDCLMEMAKYIYNIWDFSGHALYFLLHQAFLSPHAVYILVFDVSEDLEAQLLLSPKDSTVTELHKEDLTTMNLIHYWLAVIHSLVGRSAIISDKEEGKDESNVILQPQVILVGTHRNSVHLEPITRDQIIKETFDKIFQSVESKPYANHLLKKYITLDCKEMSPDEPRLNNELRLLIQNTIKEQKLVDFDIPVPWLEFEQIVERLKQRGIFFADFNQLHEVTRSKVDALYSVEVFNSALHFYHNQGIIFCLDHHNGNFSLPESQTVYDCTFIILDPQWFINSALKLCNSVKNMTNEENGDASQIGILTEKMINESWHDIIEQKLLLLGCLEKLDIICEMNPYLPIEDVPDVTASTIMPKMYFFPWISQSNPENEQAQVGTEAVHEANFQLVIDFVDLPVGLFSRLLVRLSRWSWNQGWGRRPEMYNSEGRIAVDFDHDLVLKICLKYNRIFLMIIKIFDGLQADQNEGFLSGPTANVCVKVQHLIESELDNLRNIFYRRTVFKLVVPCPCDVTCEPHSIDGCNDIGCLHFLPLEECLSKKVIECKFTRQIRTLFIQRYFPHAPYNAGQNDEQSMETFRPVNGNGTMQTGWDRIFQVEPVWMREAAKLLSPNHPNRDWMALAKRLGYGDRDISKFIDDVTPSLALLRDWYETNGRTRYCVDVLLSCLRMISREDIINLIEYDLEPEGSAPPIFISYQWDSQEQVLELRRKLELAGFPCWMDVGSMGGGDLMYGKIYDGISRARVVLCCLTPRYAASPLCSREVTLADVLHKPILPIILEQTPWPPPGPMAVIMSSIVYVDLCGVGGHGGIGKSGDTESRFRDILDRVSRYIAGYIDAPVMAPRYLHIPDIFSPMRDSNNQLALTSSSTAIRDDMPLENDREFPDRNRGAASAEAQQEELIPEDIASEDDLSVLSNQRRVPANRITNCSICSIL